MSTQPDIAKVIRDLPCHAPCGVVRGKCGSCGPCKAGKLIDTLSADLATARGGLQELLADQVFLKSDQKLMHDLRADLATANDAIRWRKVSEELPKQGDHFWGFHEDWGVADAYMATNGICFDVAVDDCTPTHWMPLPALPEGR